MPQVALTESRPSPEAHGKRKHSEQPIGVDLEAEEDRRQTSKLVISREEIMAEANSQVEEIPTLSGLRLTVECDEVSGDDPLDTSDEEMPIVLEKAKKKSNKKEVKQTPAETEADRKLRRLNRKLEYEGSFWFFQQWDKDGGWADGEGPNHPNQMDHRTRAHMARLTPEIWQKFGGWAKYGRNTGKQYMERFVGLAGGDRVVRKERAEVDWPHQLKEHCRCTSGYCEWIRAKYAGKLALRADEGAAPEDEDTAERATGAPCGRGASV